MPLMMDENLDVDELFGGPTSLELNLSSEAPAVKGLSQKVDELRLSGCCRKVAWGRMGAIAYISGDGQKVFLQYLACRSEDGKWSLSGEKPTDVIAQADATHRFTHLQWNELGSELVVVDTCGRISTYVMSAGLNVFSLQRPASTDPDDDGNQPVGLMWLNINRTIYATHKAVRENGRWIYSRFPRRFLGPLSPGNKSGLVCVTRTGVIRFFYQTPESKWAEIATDLKSIGYSSGTLTHAAMVAVEGGGILIATYSASGRLCIYRATIKWESAQSSSGQQRQGGPGNAFPAPTGFQLVHIKSTTPRPPYHPPGTETEGSFAQSDFFRLTHLEIITGPPDAPGGAFPPSALGIFSVPPASADNQGQGPSSALVRWEIGSMAQGLHSSFEDAVSKKSTAQLKPKAVLQRQEDIYFDRFVVSVDHMDTKNLLAITFDDSNISFYDAKKMEPVEAFSDITTVTSMPQAGFAFPSDTSGLHISFSPSGCVAAVIDGEGQLHLRVMEHSFGVEDGGFNEGKYSSAIAAFALAYGSSCCSDASFDDILLIAARYLSAESQKTFLGETYRALGTSVDFTIEQEKLINNPYVAKNLSLQAALGFVPSARRRSPAPMVAWFTIQLRQISLIITYFGHACRNNDSGCHDPGILRILHGSVKWALDLAKYLVDDLFEIAHELKKQTSDAQSGTQPSHFDSVTIALVLASIPRSLLRYICRALRGLPQNFKNASNLSTESFHIYSQIVSFVEDSPLKPDVGEKLLVAVSSVVDAEYKNAGYTPADRATPECELLTTSSVPPVLQPAVSKVLNDKLPLIRPEVDRMRLYLHDYSWLGICDDKVTEKFHQTHKVDVVTRKVVRLDESTSRKGVLARRNCVRCYSIAEDPIRSGHLFRMQNRINILRSCSCGGIWVVEKQT